ncbi:hypothetical protein [Marseilla massiliensis]|uniref:Uncharacterized protein n=2 Tax=Marseilla massiliensis TaxID=1841864 RepID=A0A938WMN6_9BACT|nr:hypothetical protein [Marseilla massiliensis]MBM6661772.1 hypothetical protein [Marseilla massiliensis]MCL1611448.1 hypothetical protein [Marseilla massiliensis]
MMAINFEHLLNVYGVDMVWKDRAASLNQSGDAPEVETVNLVSVNDFISTHLPVIPFFRLQK